MCLFVFSLVSFWLCWIFVAAQGLSLVGESWGFSLQWLLLRSTGSRARGLSSCSATGLVPPGHTDREGLIQCTCIGRWILFQCVTREVQFGHKIDFIHTQTAKIWEYFHYSPVGCAAQSPWRRLYRSCFVKLLPLY